MPDARIINKAIDIIEKRRLDAKNRNEHRFKEVELKIPEIKEINRQLANTSLEIMQIIKSGGNNLSQKIDELKKYNIQAQIMVGELLEKNGFSRDYLDMHYHCDKCWDTGFYQNKRCGCLNELITSLAVEEFNKHSNIKLTDFSTFSLDYYKGLTGKSGEDCFLGMREIYGYCINYAKTFSPNSKSIFMVGNTGLGKTHLSLAIASSVIKKGFSVLYDSVPNFLRHIEKEHFGRNASNGDTLDLIISADLLILDDLGAEFDSSFYVSAIYNIINTRLNKELPTIISTNLTPVEIERKYDARLVSRLFAMYDYLKFMGSDIRHIKKLIQSMDPED